MNFALRNSTMWQCCLVLLFCVLTQMARSDVLDYTLPGPYQVQAFDTEWRDVVRDRAIPVRVFIPVLNETSPAVVFSHGLGGSREAGGQWGKHWASYGIVSLHVQHPGSDSEVWKSAGNRLEAIGSLKRAMNTENLMLRLGDMKFVVDVLTGKVKGTAEPLPFKVNPAQIGAAGHSFGAVTTQALAGQRFKEAGSGQASFGEDRFKSFLALSPSARGKDVEWSFAEVRRPFLSITGTADSVKSLNDVEPDNRLLPFANMPAGNKYLLVFDGGEHHMFGGGGGGLANASPTPARITAAIKATTVAFWLSTLTGSDVSKRWLNANEVRSVLEGGDNWQSK